MKNKKIKIYILVVSLGMAAVITPFIIDNLKRVNLHRFAQDTLADARTCVAAIRYLCGVN